MTSTHRLLIEKIIIAASHLSPEKEWWRNGIAFFDSELKCSAAMIADSQEKSLHWHITGKKIELLLARIIKTIKEIEICPPTSVQLRCKDGDWKEETTFWKTRHSNNATASNENREISSGKQPYQHLILEETKTLQEIPPTPTQQTMHFHKTVIVNVHNNTTHSTTENHMNNNYDISGQVIGSLIGGTSETVSINTGNIALGITGNDIQTQAASINTLIALLKDAHDFEGRDSSIRHLEKAAEELKEPSPDKNLVAKCFEKVTNILNTLEKGSDLYTKFIELPYIKDYFS